MLKRLFTLFIVSFVWLLVFLPGCVERHDKKLTSIVKTDTIPQRNSSIKGSFSDQHILHIDSSHVISFFNRFTLLNKYKSDVFQFYKYRHYSYAWYETPGLTEQANNLYAHLNDLHVEGIQEKPPYIKTLDSLINSSVTKENPDLEILLTTEYLFYADKVWNGLPENQTTKLQWYLPRKKINLPYLTDSLIRDTAALLFSDNYSNRQYNLLKGELKKYRQLDSLQNWKIIGGKNISFRLNDSSADIFDLRQRLILLGDLKAGKVTDVFDNNLQEAVKSFQARYGLQPNGEVDAAFLRYLNTPLQDDIRKIVINMERARWIPLDLRNHYLIVNIPSFTLYAFDNDTIKFSMNVVVGKDVHKTVLFSGDIKYIVFSPYWDIPPSIQKNEVIPAIKRDPNYLKRNNMEWVGNRVRQKPGPKNSLGQVKFLFPNSYNIYLHDTPAKSLFGKPARAFSHGCIRLGEPKKLAVFLLRNDSQWPADKITQAMQKGVEKYVTLKKAVPVYIGYLTAFVDNEGRINFRDDVYKRDIELEKTILK